MSTSTNEAEAPGELYVLKLFISGATLRSADAIACVKSICEQELHGRYQLEVIDINQQPELARPYEIVAVPTLIKQFPKPSRHIVGELSDKERVLVGLDIIQRRASGANADGAPG